MNTDRNPMYRMPIGYGPATGPRRAPDGGKFDESTGRECFKYTLSFLTAPEALTKHLPPRFSLAGEPVVSVYTRYKKNIQWLGGRGYNVVNVSFPARFEGKKESVTADFVSVVWENLTEPILTGREELGCPKIFADIPDPMEVNGSTYCSASWMGFKFLDIRIANLRPATEEENRLAAAKAAQSAGFFYYKYIPRSGDWGLPDVEYAVLTPKETPNVSITRRRYGKGSVSFSQAAWEDLPTQYMIVNALRELEIREMLEAKVTESTGGKDLSDQRILE